MLDIKNGNHLWQNAVEKEITALLHHNCFQFMAHRYKPSPDYQYAPLNLVFEAKPDLTRYDCLVIMGNVVDPVVLQHGRLSSKGYLSACYPSLHIGMVSMKCAGI